MRAIVVPPGAAPTHYRESIAAARITTREESP
jgi:hypothetical protein